jgi:anaerobic magnesium-protoporphyrin IX monomethyl ester cyclase
MSMGSQIQRILFIYPPTTIFRKVERKRIGFPLGITYLSAVLIKEGLTVKILDASLEDYDHEEELSEHTIRFGMTFNKIRDTISGFRPDIIGISALYTSQAGNVHELCRLSKEVSGDIITVLGGAYPTSETEFCMQDFNVDFAILGEGEESFLSLLRSLQNGKVNAVEGIAYRDNGAVKINPKSSFIKNLDNLPMPARHLLKLTEYSEVPCGHGVIKHKPFATVISSRGCPFQCTFCFSCKMHGVTFRPRSAKNVLDEIESLIEQYHIKEIHFEDDNITFDRKRALEIFQGIIDRKFNIAWTAPNGLSVSTLDKELLLKMKESGCYGVILAIESGSQRVLSEIMRKPVNLKKAEEIVRLLKDIGLNVACYWMLGLPGETKKEIRETIDFASKLKSINPNLYSSFSVFTPFKKTKLHELCREKKYFVSNADLDPRFNKMKFCTGVIDTEEFTHEWIEKMRYQAWLEANHINTEKDLKSSPDVGMWIPG